MTGTMNLRQALEWVAFGTPPMPTDEEDKKHPDRVKEYNNYGACDPDGRSLHGHSSESIEIITEAKSLINQALCDGLIEASGIIDDERTTIPKDFWSLDHIDWDSSSLSFTDDIPNHFWDNEFTRIDLDSEQIQVRFKIQASDIGGLATVFTESEKEAGELYAAQKRSKDAKKAVSARNTFTDSAKDKAAVYLTNNRRELVIKFPGNEKGTINKRAVAEEFFWNVLTNDERYGFPMFRKVKERAEKEKAITRNEALRKYINDEYPSRTFPPYVTISRHLN